MEKSVLLCAISPSALPCRTEPLQLCLMISVLKNWLIWRWFPPWFTSLPVTSLWKKLRIPGWDHIILTTQLACGHRQQGVFHLMPANSRVKVIQSRIYLKTLQQMVRLHKNNKAGNPYKHYIFCRTSFFRLRSYKDNLQPKQIGQAPSKQNNVPHRRRYLIPTGKQGTPLFFYPHVTQ